ncbi:MAG: 16S rRNA (uracil(1498)-N(3))-methyltransferase [Candidatus Baltobacteraceae bacterium]
MAGTHETGDELPVEGADAHKIVDVLRLRDGDFVEAIDSAANVFLARIVLAGRSVHLRLSDVRGGAPAPRLRVSLAQAVPKAQKMDYVVEKLTELGAEAIVPFRSERTIGAVTQSKLDRWTRLAKSAALQCGRTAVPVIAPALSFDDLLRRFAHYDCVLLAWELAPRDAPLDRLAPLVREAARMLVVIGPEGGFSHAEAERAKAAGAHLVWLGPRVLRSETAGLVALAFVNLLSGG